MANDPHNPPELASVLAALNRAIFIRESKQAAKLYGEVLQQKPNYLLRPPVQYDLARLLELGDELELAYLAYSLIITRQTENTAYNPALKAAGHLAYRLQKYDRALEHLEAFLKTNPTTPERQDAEEILSRLPPSAKKGRRPEGVSAQSAPTAGKDPVAIPPSNWSISDSNQPKPVTFEFKMAVGAKAQKTPPPPTKNKPPATDAAGSAIRLPDLKEETPKARAPQAGPGPRQPVVIPDTNDFAAAPPPRAPAITKLSPDSATMKSIAVPEGAWEMPSKARPQQAAPPAPPTAPPTAPSSYRPPLPSREQVRLDFRSDSADIDTGPLMKTPLAEGPVAPAVPPPAVRMNASAPPPSPRTSGEFSRESIAKLTPGAPPTHETPEQRYDRLRDAHFALLLPVGKRIHLEAVAALIAKYEDIDEAHAKKLVLRKKGILYDELSLHAMLELLPQVRACRQALVFVAVPRALRPYENYEVHAAEVRDQGLKLTTHGAIRRLRWGDMRMINCGTVDTDIVVTILASDPIKEYRFSSSSFDYRSFNPQTRVGFAQGFAEFLRAIQKHAPEALLSHTAQLFLSGATSSPQIFATREEFTFYTLWMLFSHFAEQVNAEELLELSQVTSNW